MQCYMLGNTNIQCYIAQELKHAMLHCSGTQTFNVTLLTNSNIQCYIAKESKHAKLHCSGTRTCNATLLRNPNLPSCIAQEQKHAMIYYTGTRTCNATLLRNANIQCYFAQEQKQAMLYCSGIRTCNATLLRNRNIQSYIAQEPKHALLHSSWTRICCSIPITYSVNSSVLFDQSMGFVLQFLPVKNTTKKIIWLEIKYTAFKCLLVGFSYCSTNAKSDVFNKFDEDIDLNQGNFNASFAWGILI